MCHGWTDGQTIMDLTSEISVHLFIRFCFCKFLPEHSVIYVIRFSDPITTVYALIRGEDGSVNFSK
jgi:hypothetical protein